VLVDEPHAEAARMILAPPPRGDRPRAAVPPASHGSAAAPVLRD